MMFIKYVLLKYGVLMLLICFTLCQSICFFITVVLTVKIYENIREEKK